MGIMQEETGGIVKVDSNGNRDGDVMQSSESDGFPAGYYDEEQSIKNGVEHFAAMLAKANESEYTTGDMKAVVAAYNMGPGSLEFLWQHQSSWNIELADDFSQKLALQIGGELIKRENYYANTDAYKKSILDQYAFTYTPPKTYIWKNGGNMHYAELVVGHVSCNSGEFQSPMASGVVTCEFHCYTDQYGPHAGIDLSNSQSVPILAAASGTVTVSGVHTAYGEYISIKHTINGQDYVTKYAHLAAGSRRVKVGDIVASGQQIGMMGSTGNSTGPHLHFEIHKGQDQFQASAQNPRDYISWPALGTWW
jgi:murein DD-endopeptidase MepM/ murein hydrolase activator NlpD